VLRAESHMERIFLDPIELVREFWRRMDSNDFTTVTGLLDDTFIADWPQSNERIRGGSNFARMNQEYPSHGPWRFTIQRLFGNATDVVSVVDVTDGVQSATAITFFTINVYSIARIVEYWPDPFPAGANRAHLTERITPD
jgi:hypothetical protein